MTNDAFLADCGGAHGATFVNSSRTATSRALAELSSCASEFVAAPHTGELLRSTLSFVSKNIIFITCKITDNTWKSLEILGFPNFENNLKSFGILGFLRMSTGFLSFTKTNTRVCGLAKLQECGGAITRQRMIFDTLERLRAD